jgi:hypothetical protein
LGRPWLFGQIAAGFAGLPVPAEPTADVVLNWLRRHAVLLAQMHGDEFLGAREMRKHMAWYLKGLVVGSTVRTELAMISSLAQLDDLLTQIDPNQRVGAEIANSPRGRTTPDKKVSLPDGWLDSPYVTDAQRAEVQAAEINVSGG